MNEKLTEEIEFKKRKIKKLWERLFQYINSLYTNPMNKNQLKADRSFVQNFVQPSPSFYGPAILIERNEVLVLLAAQDRVSRAEERERIIKEFGDFGDGCGCCERNSLKDVLSPNPPQND